MGKYVSLKTKILMKHNICNNEYEVRPGDFIYGANRCPKCYKTTPYTNETFQQKVDLTYGKEYVIIGNYKNYKTKVLVEHLKCNYSWEVNPSSLLKGYGCPKCSNRIPYTTETFKEKVKQLTNDEFEVIGEYINTKTKIEIRHKKCGYVNNIVSSSFLRNLSCPFCYGNVPYTTETFKQKIEEVFPSEFTILSEYKNAFTNILVRHNICNHERWVRPNSLLTKSSICPKCNKKLRYTTETFNKKISNITNDEYVLIGEYNSHKIKLKHHKCNNIWEVAPGNFLYGTRCPICNESKGEQKIRHWLELNHIKFEAQHTFNGLIGLSGGQLKFDFAVFNNNKLQYLIEYDGEQHFRSLDINGYNFNTTLIHDIRKNLYCAKNNIRLIRIPYWEYDNIEKYLEEYIRSD